MAPRGRTRKRGNTRMDAALDAMRPFGFPSPIVRQTLKQLLKEYGGDDGWVFIEDSSYILLIETILKNYKDSSDDNTRIVKDTETSTAGPSCGVVDTQLIAAAHVFDSASHRTEASDFEAQIDDSGAQDDNIPTVGGGEEEERGGVKDLLAIDSGKRDEDDLGDSQAYKDLASTLNMQSPRPEAFLSSGQRRPYHGWICDDDDHDPNDLVDLIPEPLPEALKKLLTPTKKRISRWDVKPRNV